jgi:peptidyl-prolyl cis-trans isomerase C
MRRVVRAAAIALVAPVALVVGGGCHKEPPSAVVDDAGAAPSASADVSTDQRVLARVGAKTITVADYAAALQNMDEFDRVRYSAAARRRELLDDMIDVKLLADEARERGYDKDPIAEQETREILRDAILRKAWGTVPAPNEIPEGEVRAYFDAHSADFHDPERRRAGAIVVPTEAAATTVLGSALKATPVEWGQLVRAKSVDPQAKADVAVDLAGDFGFVSPPGDPRGTNERIPEPVRAAVFEIAKVGDVLPRVVSGAGQYYVVKYEGRSEAHDRSFQDAERSIRVKLAQDKRRAAEDALLADLRKQYPVQVDEGALSQVKVSLPDAGRD